MKKVFLAVLTLGILSCNQDKLGYVDNDDLINELQEKKDLEAAFKTKIEAFTKKRDSLSTIINMEEKDFQEKAKRMNNATAQAAYKSLMERSQFIAQQLQQEQQAIQLESQTKIDSLISKVKSHVQDFGKTNGYTFIFGANQAGSVMYGEATKDLTKSIRDELNTAYKK
ncbi:MAG: OmpH family outer membrane protein [Flavobacteriaceae bacterium]|nr:OmpH family outer membrane protein [Flavobacteriaceae bacterium]